MDEKDKAQINAPLLPQIFSLLQECLLTMKWQDALKIIRALVHKPVGVTTTVWRVSIALFRFETNW